MSTLEQIRLAARATSAYTKPAEEPRFSAHDHAFEQAVGEVLGRPRGAFQPSPAVTIEPPNARPDIFTIDSAGEWLAPTGGTAVAGGYRLDIRV